LVLATAFLSGVSLLGDRTAQVLVATLFAIIFALGARVAMPPEAHRMRTARYAVWVFGGVLALVAGLQPQIDRLVSTALTAFFSQSDDWIAANTSLASVGLVLLTTMVMFVAFLFFLRDSAPLGRIALDPLVRD
jgi:hypothetical protein